VMERFNKPLPSTVKTEAPKLNKPIHAPSIDPNFDFTGFALERLPYWVLKAAKHGAVQSHIIVGKTECVECKRKIWTCDLKLEDTCEECSYVLFEKLSEMRQQRAGREQRGIVNPFAPREDE
jgi:hypothetical protein